MVGINKLQVKTVRMNLAKQMLKDGKTYDTICRELHCSKSVISEAKKRLKTDEIVRKIKEDLDVEQTSTQNGIIYIAISAILLAGVLWLLVS